MLPTLDLLELEDMGNPVPGVHIKGFHCVISVVLPTVDLLELEDMGNPVPGEGWRSHKEI